MPRLPEQKPRGGKPPGLLQPKWVGPFVVDEKISRLNHKPKYLKSGRINGPIHVGELKQYFKGYKLPKLRRRTREIASRQRRRRGMLRRTAIYNTRSRRNI